MSRQAPSPGCRRGDPLDIPLIDNHLAINLLFPRITSAIKWVLPSLHLDWTTSGGGAIVDGVQHESRHSFHHVKNPLLWKRLMEILLHTSLMLGSSQLIQRRRKDGSLVSDISIRTPAMRNLGVFLRPCSNTSDGPPPNPNSKRRLRIEALRARIQLYSKLFALLAATVIGPRLYDELKQRRQKQLREQERERRSLDLYLPSRPSNNQHLPQREREQNIINERAEVRKSRLQTMLSDFILGTADVFMPTLRVINYISYIWGLSSTPDLGMRLVGWDYASFADTSEPAVTGFGQQYQRHANFHYGNRRLLVEEALRTVSSVIPPREHNTAVTPTARPALHRERLGRSTNTGLDTPAQNETADNTRRAWFRKRALSFMGVVEEKDDTATQRCSLKCTKCNTENPTIAYIASCGHCYCYICLRMSVTDDIYFQCLDCGKPVTTSCRVDFNET